MQPQGTSAAAQPGASTVKARVYQLDTEKKMATTMPKDARTARTMARLE